MNNKYMRFLLGLNAASLFRGFRFGWRDLHRASQEGFAAATNLESYELRTIPAASLGALLDNRKIYVKLRVMKYEDGMLPYRDATALFSLLVAENPKEVLEIGTFMGHTTR